MTSLPDADWVQHVNAGLADDPAWTKTVADVGDPLYIKVKSDDATEAVILAVGDGKAAPPVAIHPSDKVEGEGIIVSMTYDVWDRLLRGSTDLMTAFMGRDIKATAPMFKLMKLADPAERLIEHIAKVRPEAKA